MVSRKMVRRVLMATSNAGKLRDFAGAAVPYGITIANIAHFSSLPRSLTVWPFPANWF